MIYRKFLIEIATRVGVAVGAVVLWQVAQVDLLTVSGRSRDGEVVIHVAELDAEIFIDGRPYPLPRAFGVPASCILRAGNHTLTMRLDGKTLYRKEFTLEPGGNAVLTAWDERKSRASIEDEAGLEGVDRKSTRNVADPIIQRRIRRGLQ